MQVSTKEAPELIEDIIASNLVPMISGSPGIAKSDIVRSIAEKFNLELIDFRLSQCDPVLLMGFPAIKGEKSSFIPLSNFPLESDPLPKGKDGWMIFYDEINTAANSVQAAAYKLILDKMVGDKKLHKNVVQIAAGNLASDKAVTNRMSTAMQSRMIHLELEIDLDGWLNWAYENEIDYRIIAFIKFRPELLHNFDPNHSDNTFSCP